jgi:hypothetical protein
MRYSDRPRRILTINPGAARCALLAFPESNELSPGSRVDLDRFEISFSTFGGVVQRF